MKKATVEDWTDGDEQQEPAEPHRSADDVQDERHHRLVVEGVIAGVPLRAHRHERCNRV